MKVYILPDFFRKFIKVGYIIYLVLLLLFVVCGIFVNLEWFIAFAGFAFVLIFLTTMCYMNKKFFYHCEICDDSIKSYSFSGDELYTLDTSAPVYYALFTPDLFECIALSNEKIEYNKIDGEYSPREFFKYYDDTKLLVLPYNSATRKFLKLDEWIKI